jgi:hypothetical protein
MKLLVFGSRALDSRPVGRCSSRGWIRYVESDDRSRGTYELKPVGRAQPEAHLNGTLAPERDTISHPEGVGVTRQYTSSSLTK